ncbi:MAG: tetratricopeptide repeat protein [Acidobacteria bacterium]|nr:tetratricopeptide repeat protein [Acidobacteriota bacterium]
MPIHAILTVTPTLCASGGFGMRNCLHFGRLALAVALLAGLSTAASAQVGRVGGMVKNDAGEPIKGATITAENPQASPSSVSATTDDKGRFSVIGLRAGGWKFTASAPGYDPESGTIRVATVGAPNPPLTFTLKKGPGGALAGLSSAAAKDLQGELAAADADYNSGNYDGAIEKYKAVLAKAPGLSALHLQIAAAYRNKKDYDSALASYNDLLKVSPDNEQAVVGIGMTNLEKGDLDAAEATLTQAAALPNPSREVFYDLGEVLFAKGEIEKAAEQYQKAAAADPTWGKPLFKLALVELNKGDKAATITAMEKVIAVDPTSPEAAQAQAVIADLKK